MQYFQNEDELKKYVGRQEKKSRRDFAVKIIAYQIQAFFKIPQLPFQQPFATVNIFTKSGFGAFIFVVVILLATFQSVITLSCTVA
jgi:hypothetical protein